MSLSKQDYSETTIKSLAREAHVSLRTFYQHFDSKEACFHAAFREVTAYLLEPDRLASEQGADWRSSIERSFGRHLREMTRLPRLTYALVIDSATMGHAVRVERGRLQCGLAEQLVRQVELGREAHPGIPSRSLPMSVARLTLSGLDEMVIDLIVRDEIERLPELAQAATAVVWDAISIAEPPNAQHGAGTAAQPS